MRATVRHGLRLLLEQPVASLVSVACLSAGIAATATALTLTDATVLRPYGVPAAGSLVVLWESELARPQDLIEISLPNFQDWAERARSFDSMAAFGSSHWPGIARAGGESFAIAPRAVSRRFFETLGRQPLLGRDFDEQDLLASTTAPVMLSHALWVARFNASPDAVGRTMFIDNDEHRVIGVMPRGFAFPDAPDVWILVERALGDVFRENAMPPDQQRALGVLQAVARIRHGVSHSEAQAELTVIQHAIAQEHRLPGTPSTPVMTPFAEVVVGQLGARVWIAVVMTAAVLLFACFNVAFLRTAQLRARAGELAVRLCLGASRRRLATELLAETIPLVAISVAAALILARGLEAWLGQIPAISASGLALNEFRATAWISVALFGLLAGLAVSVVPAAMALGRSDERAAALVSRTVIRGSRGTQRAAHDAGGSCDVPCRHGERCLSNVHPALGGRRRLRQSRRDHAGHLGARLEIPVRSRADATRSTVARRAGATSRHVGRRRCVGAAISVRRNCRRHASAPTRRRRQREGCGDRGEPGHCHTAILRRHGHRPRRGARVYRLRSHLVAACRDRQ